VHDNVVIDFDLSWPQTPRPCRDTIDGVRA
jgi:hypothetical protein